MAGIVISMVTTEFDPDHRVMSPFIVDITWETWALLFGLTLSGIFAFVLLYLGKLKKNERKVLNEQP